MNDSHAHRRFTCPMHPEIVRDAPGICPICGMALAAADVGIAMGTGTDVAISSSQVTLVKGDLRGIARALSMDQASALADDRGAGDEPVVGIGGRQRAAAPPISRVTSSAALP